MNFSMKHKLCLTFACIILAISAVQNWLASERMTRDAEQSTQRAVSSLSQSALTSISHWLENKAAITQSVIPAFDHQAAPIDALAQTMNAGQFDLVYVGLPTGKVILSKAISFPADYDARERPWYQKAKAENRTIITSPYIDASSNKLVVTLARPFNASMNQGVIAADVSIDTLVKDVLAMNQDGMFAMLIDADGNIIAHPDASLALKPATGLNSTLTTSTIESMSRNDALTTMTISGVESLVQIGQVPDTQWYFALVVNKAKAFEQVDEALFDALIGTIMQVVIVIGAALFFVGRALKPLEQLTDAMQDLSQGNGDLTRRLDFTQDDEIGHLGGHVNAFIEKLHHSVSGIANSTSQLSEQASVSHAMAEQNSQAIQMQLGEIAQIATAIHEMSATAQDVANHAEQTASAAVASHANCNEGKAVITRNQASITQLAHHVEDAASIIQELENNAQEINAILSTIQGIAEQTNLLALNAAIEAARAGEQGRGFAVVADEVRVLSQRTHSSTVEIRSMIETLQRNTHNAVTTMQQSQDMATGSVEEANNATLALEQITASIQYISDMATQISSAAEEQRAVSEEISRNTQAVNDVSEQLSTDAKETQVLAQDLNSITQHLTSEVNKFKI
ncbi:methyl-accepting chemotaxis protein [Photobacterium aphoticum]|uniref:Methyl-accepting chemotaxis protein n=1 Tax=Photobacterium aphoticum TaxID=754436 RepID=A0A090QMT2_9GAMM|nr:methyl-accepting chemotaxis protein [Photobacterium aphoticum]